MCGIGGTFVFGERRSRQALAEDVSRMMTAISNRGPDGSGYFVDENAGIALGHRRLAIIDVTMSGHQPMMSKDGRFVLTFNGEVYNFLQLRRALEGQATAISWRGTSDTEVLLEAIATWGVEETLARSVGMFAFALWDTKKRSLTLARDRAGEKPLCYGFVNGRFVFASELRAIRALPDFNAPVNRAALTSFLRFNYVPSPETIFHDLWKLPPGSFLIVNEKNSNDAQLVPTNYWSVESAILKGGTEKFDGSSVDATDELERLLRQSIQGQMISDVPLGAFLSGGVDSSTVVALMQQLSARPVKTFTIGFQQSEFNEAGYAKKVAHHIGTEHHELYVSTQDAMKVIPSLPDIYDEPFSDSSQIPTFLVSQLARSSVTVALSGDGGDELFGGYNRYLLASRLWGTIDAIPAAMRKAVGRAMLAVPTINVAQMGKSAGKVFPATAKLGSIADKIQKAALILQANGPDALYQALVSHWPNPKDIVRSGYDRENIFSRFHNNATSLSFVEWMMYVDTCTYLPDDILVKVDRAAMGVSLETRVPLLDHRLIDFAWSLPQHLRVGSGGTKRLLRSVLHRYVPAALVDRPKMGFGVPLGDWIRTGLRPWAEDLLSTTRLVDEGFFNPCEIRKKWDEHQSGARNWQYLLWDILMFESWLARENPITALDDTECRKAMQSKFSYAD